MVRANIYDRLSQRREAAEAAARQQAEEARRATDCAMQSAPPPSVLPLNAEQNALRIAGLNLQMPAGFAFRDIDTTLEFAGCHVQFSVRRRNAPEGLELSDAVELFTRKLRQRHTDMTVVRQAETILAGHSAISLDYQFSAGQERRHGRAVCTIIVSADGNGRQWLNMATVTDPDKLQLANWLIEFDAMLAGMTA